MPRSFAFLRQRLEFPFPAPDPPSGIPLSNGTLGALLWGEGRKLRITLNRSDYWTDGDGAPLPMGRLDLVLPADWLPASGGLHLATGEAELELDGYREAGKLRATLLRDTPVVCLRITGVPGVAVTLESRPPDAPEVVERLRQLGLSRAEVFDLGEFGGWVQEGPEGTALCAGWLRHDAPSGLLLFLTAVYGPTAGEARKQALQTLETVSAEGYTPATLRSFSAWRKWWENIPASTPGLGKAILQHLSSYRLAGTCAPLDPDATAAVIQDDFSLRLNGGEVALLGRGGEVGTFSLIPPCLEGDSARGHKREPRAYRRPLE